MRIVTRLAASVVTAGVVLAGPGVAGAPGARAAGAVPRGAGAAPRAAAAAPAGVRAHWAELANAVTGGWLWSRSSTAERPMGSVTKVMTAYVVIQAGHLNRVITVPASVTGYDRKYDASTAGLRPGEKLTALQLLYAMMLPSGCDAAYTLATAYGPGRAAFIARMNATARALGLTRTHFTDFSGLPDPGEYTTYSTARDLVALGRAAMRLALLRQVVGTRSYHVPATSAHRAHTWKNSDKLLGGYRGLYGIKTGFTNAAGECFLFIARRGARTLIGVVLHSSSGPPNADAAFADATRMLNWGFSR